MENKIGIQIRETGLNKTAEKPLPAKIATTGKKTSPKTADKAQLSPEARGTGAGFKARLGKVKNTLLRKTPADNPEASRPLTKKEAVALMDQIQDLTLGQSLFSSFDGPRVAFLPFGKNRQGKEEQLNFMQAFTRLEKGEKIKFKTYQWKDFEHTTYDFLGDPLIKGRSMTSHLERKHKELDFKAENFRQLRDNWAEFLKGKMEIHHREHCKTPGRTLYVPFVEGKEKDKKITLSKAVKLFKQGREVAFKPFVVSNYIRDEEGELKETAPYLKDAAIVEKPTRLSDLNGFSTFALKILNARYQPQEVPSGPEILREWRGKMEKPEASRREGEVFYQPFKEINGEAHQIGYDETASRLEREEPVYFQPKVWTKYDDFGAFLTGDSESKTHHGISLGMYGSLGDDSAGQKVKWTKIGSLEELRNFYAIEKKSLY